MADLLAVPGVETLSKSDIATFVSMCERHEWDADALATVISSESRWVPYAGVYAWTPERTASGILQFIEQTAKGLGVKPTADRPSLLVSHKGDGRSWATWRVLGMSVSEQIPLVERFYMQAFGGSVPPRLVDYYTVPWGAGWGLSDSTVLARVGSPAYEGNKGLDANGDGQITVSDLESHLRRIQGYASTRFEGLSDSAVAPQGRSSETGPVLLLGAAAVAAVALAVRSRTGQYGNSKKTRR